MMKPRKNTLITKAELTELELFALVCDRDSRSAAALARKVARRQRDKRRRFTPSQRAACAERDGYACAYCGCDAPKGHADHVIPWSRGGQTVLENALWACAKCNTSKGAKVW